MNDPIDASKHTANESKNCGKVLSTKKSLFSYFGRSISTPSDSYNTNDCLFMPCSDILKKIRRGPITCMCGYYSMSSFNDIKFMNISV
jgi:hypothetical protein